MLIDYIYILFVTLLFFTLLSWLPKNKPFMEERLFFSMFGMITAFILGVGVQGVQIPTGADALVTTTDTALGFYFFGWGIVLLIRLLFIMAEVYREETDPSAILDREERDSIWDGHREDVV